MSWVGWDLVWVGLDGLSLIKIDYVRLGFTILSLVKFDLK